MEPRVLYMAGVLEGKTALALGVANKMSIAWGIAEALSAAGAEVILTYQGERLKKRVEALAADLGSGAKIYPCDVANDGEIEALFEALGQDYDKLDILLHSIAFAPKESLEGRFVDTTREAFRVAHDISAYSLVGLTRAALPLMGSGGSVLCLTYYGAEKVVPNYNVMGVAKASLEASTRYLAADLGQEGIRVNAISAGPVNTLAARGISGFTTMLEHHKEKAPLKRNVELNELGATAVFLASDGSTGITGQTLYVDCGYQIMAN